MFSVISEFCANVGLVGDSVKFLFYKDRLFVESYISGSENSVEAVQDSAQAILSEYKSGVAKLAAIMEGLQQTSSEGHVPFCHLETQGRERG